jgi:2-amino-4-hydroxy-6-hydroxymethyldihydropteridine diphosphokinase
MKSFLHTIYLCLGTNLGNKGINLDLAIEHISEHCGTVIGKSGVYSSTAWGYESENEFYNQCLKIETHLTPDQLIDTLLSIEEEMGRTRGSSGYTDRKMDIDVLFYDSIVINTAKLILPHPRIAGRRFVLAPMAELAPDFIHPLLELSMKKLLKVCTDKGSAMIL